MGYVKGGTKMENYGFYHTMIMENYMGTLNDGTIVEIHTVTQLTLMVRVLNVYIIRIFYYIKTI